MDTTQFMHYRPTHNGRTSGAVESLGGVTAAIQVVSEKKAVVGLAYCSPEDNFHKKLGRTIALGRIRSYLTTNTDTTTPGKMVFEISTTENQTFKQAVHSVIGHEMNNMGYY